MQQPAALLSIRGVSKRFGAVQALDRVDLDFQAGEIHAILGENGAGKSTLMHVLDGVFRPDSGWISMEGLPLELSSPRAAQAAGIGMVHQHFTLVDALSVAENLALSLGDNSSWRFDASAIASTAQALAKRVGLEIPPGETPVRDLPVGVRQRLEIVKALAGAGRVLILDEPTAVLTPQEVVPFFAMLRHLRSQQRLVLFITHKLREVKQLADRVTVMRRGQVVGTFTVGATSEAQLAEAMIGSTLPSNQSLPRVASDAPVVLRVSALAAQRSDGTPALRGVGFEVHRGEIFGIAGVDGNGQRELFEVLVGLSAPQAGEVMVDGRPLRTFTPQAALAAGIGHIPPDRHREGLVLSMSVAENFLLHRNLLARFQRYGLLRREAARPFAAQMVRSYAIHCASLDEPVSSLSGGNQQRVVVARAMAETPRVLVTVNPTRGLDLAAARTVADALRAAASEGCAVVLISTDLDEVLDLSHRVGVLFRGRLSAAMEPPIDSDRLGLLMAGVEMK